MEISQSESRIVFVSEDKKYEVDVHRKQSEKSVNGEISIYVNSKDPSRTASINKTKSVKTDDLLSVYARMTPKLSGIIRARFYVSEQKELVVSKLEGDPEVIQKLNKERLDIPEPMRFVQVLQKLTEMEGCQRISTEDETIKHYISMLPQWKTVAHYLSVLRKNIL